MVQPPTSYEQNLAIAINCPNLSLLNLRSMKMSIPIAWLTSPVNPVNIKSIHDTLNSTLTRSVNLRILKGRLLIASWPAIFFDQLPRGSHQESQLNDAVHRVLASMYHLRLDEASTGCFLSMVFPRENTETLAKQKQLGETFRKSEVVSGNIGSDIVSLYVISMVYDE